MNVTLLAHTPNPEKIAASAAKLCYSSSGIDSIMEGLTEEKTADFIDMLVSVGHESVMEHVSFTFGVEGISRACSHQLVRHRIASYSQKSQRYVNENGFEYIVPPEIEKFPKLKLNLNALSKILPKAMKRSPIFLLNLIKKNLKNRALTRDQPLQKRVNSPTRTQDLFCPTPAKPKSS